MAATTTKRTPLPIAPHTPEKYTGPTKAEVLALRKQYLSPGLITYYQDPLLVVEDVAYRELSFTDDRGTSLWTLAPDVVVQVGTFSKTFFPGVRLGWAAGPAVLIEQMVRAKQNSDQCAGALGQRLVEDFLRGGHLDRQLTVSRALYATRCTAMLAALEKCMPSGVSWTQPTGGFFTWLTGPAGTDTKALASTARTAGVAFVPGTPFYPGRRGERCLRSRTAPVGPGEGASPAQSDRRGAAGHRLYPRQPGAVPDGQRAYDPGARRTHHCHNPGVCRRDRLAISWRAPGDATRPWHRRRLCRRRLPRLATGARRQ